MPDDWGTRANGFQDHFDGVALNTNVWRPYMAVANPYSYFTVSNSQLHCATPTADPNHLLFQGASYDNSNQEVLVRIRIVRFGAGDGDRAGVGLAINTANSQGANFTFRHTSSTSPYGFQFLNDAIVWSPTAVDAGTWTTNTWYWMRATHSATSNMTARVWRADGVTRESSATTVTWGDSGVRSRRGLAGLQLNSIGGTADFDVDYFLLKADGLPEIRVGPAAAGLVLVFR